MSNRIETDFISWSRAHFNLLADGGTWAIPRSGVVFQKREGELVLIERMPWDESMPITEERLRKYQNEEYAAVKLNFEKVGIPVRDETSVTVEPGPELICDFCSDTPVLWTYVIPAGKSMGNVGGRAHIDADGLWGACEVCKCLIEGRDKEALLNRCVAQFQILHPQLKLPEAVIREIGSEPHAHFWNGYDGHDPAPHGDEGLLQVLIVNSRIPRI
jgi:hypothetical protein